MPSPGLMDRRPLAFAAAGALVIAFSAILVRLAEVAPSTAAVFRCLYALPLLGLLAWLERRRYGPRSSRERQIAALVGVIAWAVLGERPDARSALAVPVVMFGVVLISGAIGAGAYGDDPLLGAV